MSMAGPPPVDSDSKHVKVANTTRHKQSKRLLLFEVIFGGSSSLGTLETKKNAMRIVLVSFSRYQSDIMLCIFGH